MFKLSSDNPTQVTKTQVLVYGAERPAEIVDRRLDGRLVVANPGKANAWLILDNAVPPTALMKALKGLATYSDIRIVVPKKERPEAVAEAIAKIEAFMTDGSAEKAAKREAAAAARATAKAAEKAAAQQAERAAAAAAREASRAEERRRIAAATRPAREAAAAERAAAKRAEQHRLNRARAQRTVYVVSDAPAVGAAFVAPVAGRDVLVVAESHGTQWVDRDGDTVCYVYWRFATDEERANHVEAAATRPRATVVTLPVECAPAVGQTFRFRDGTPAVATDVRRCRYLDSGSEDVTSFYSSELWDCTVVDVEYTTA